MDVDGLRALEQALGEPLDEPFQKRANGVHYWKFGVLFDHEVELARAVVAARNALPGLLARVAAAEAAAERPPALEQAVIQIHRLEGRAERAEAALAAAEAERDALRTALERVREVLKKIRMEHASLAPYPDADWRVFADWASNIALAVLAAPVPSGPAEPTTKETR